MESHNIRHQDRPSVLLVGYNGANNTGAEALLQSDIADVRAVLGPDAHITIPTLNEANLRRYVQETSTLEIEPVPTIYPFALRRLVQEHDLIMLVEGSTYMDTWGSVLLWAFLWTMHCAHTMGKPCLAYAVDAGQLSRLDRALVRREASRSELIIARAQAAADRLRAYGVTAPIEVTADNAFTFQTNPTDEGWVQNVWSEAASGMVGIAVVDLYLWPTVVRPWGRKEDCYKWPIYFSRSPERTRATQALATSYAELADTLVTDHGKAIALICMEQVDEPLAHQVLEGMRHANRARIFSAREYNASQMTVLLRGLDLLLTSRYHACVLSMAAQVPQVAMGHDLRLKTIYEELGLTKFFVDPHVPSLCEQLRERAATLLANPAVQREVLRRAYEEHLNKARCNRKLLTQFVRAHSWGVA